MSKSETSNNIIGNLEVIRWILTLIVASMHFFANNFDELFPFEGGYLAVDFFFAMSGFFLYKRLSKGKVNPFIYTFNRWGSMFYICVPSILVSALWMGKTNLIVSLSWMVKCIPDMLGLQYTGIFYPQLNTILWYVSVLLIAGFVLCVFSQIMKNQEHLLYVLTGLVLLGYTLANKHVGNLDATRGDSFIPLGVFRGISGMSLGMLVCHLSAYLNLLSYSKEKKNSITITIVELAAIAGFAYCVVVTPHSTNDFYALLCIPVIIIAASAQNAVWGGVLQQNWKYAL